MKKTLISILLILTFASCVKKPYTEKETRPVSDSTTIKEGHKRPEEDILQVGDWQDETYYGERKSEKIKVAILLPLSGKAGKIGNIMLQSAQLALFESRKDNILLKAYDTKGTAFGALDAINKAIADEVSIVLGPLFSTSTEAVMEKAYQNNIMVMSFSNNQMLLNKKNVYLMGFMPEQEIERVVSYAMDEGKYAFSAIVPNDTYGALISKVLKETVERKDGKIVKIEYYSKRDRSLEKKVQNVLNSFAIADRVYEEYEKEKELAKVNGSEESVEFTYEEADKIYADTILIPDGGRKLNQILDLMETNANKDRRYQLIGTSKWENENNYTNELLLNSWFVSPDPDEYSDFEERFYKVYGNFPIRVASLAYDAVNVVKKAYSKSEYNAIDKEYLTNQKGFEGIDGRFRFLPNGIVQRRFSVLEIRDGYSGVVDKSLGGFLNY